MGHDDRLVAGHASGDEPVVGTDVRELAEGLPRGTADRVGAAAGELRLDPGQRVPPSVVGTSGARRRRSVQHPGRHGDCRPGPHGGHHRASSGSGALHVGVQIHPWEAGHDGLGRADRGGLRRDRGGKHSDAVAESAGRLAGTLDCPVRTAVARHDDLELRGTCIGEQHLEGARDQAFLIVRRDDHDGRPGSTLLADGVRGNGPQPTLVPLRGERCGGLVAGHADIGDPSLVPKDPAHVHMKTLRESAHRAGTFR